MQIVTHPNNKKYLASFQETSSKIGESQGFRPILDGYEVIFSDIMPELRDSDTDFVSIADDRFTQYSTKSPMKWEVYFGFVKPVKVPHFILTDLGSAVTMSPQGPISKRKYGEYHGDLYPFIRGKQK